MKIIFLDIDGVLANMNWRYFREFSPEKVHMLMSVLKSTESKIVISSAWQVEGIDNGGSLDTELRRYGLYQYLHEDWKTGGFGRRADSIKNWLNRHPDVTEYVILDDDPLHDDDLTPRLALCDPLDGMLQANLRKVYELFNITHADVKMWILKEMASEGRGKATRPNFFEMVSLNWSDLMTIKILIEKHLAINGDVSAGTLYDKITEAFEDLDRRIKEYEKLYPPKPPKGRIITEGINNKPEKVKYIKDS